MNPFARHEHNQLQQLAYLVQEQPREAVVIVCGDFNIPRGSWLYDSFLEAGGLSDPLDGNMQPTLRPRRIMPSRYVMPIDFALVRIPHLPGMQLESRLRFQEYVEHQGRQVHLSDHCGVELSLTWDKIPAE